jgi:starch synthase
MAKKPTSTNKPASSASGTAKPAAGKAVATPAAPAAAPVAPATTASKAPAPAAATPVAEKPAAPAAAPPVAEKPAAPAPEKKAAAPAAAAPVAPASKPAAPVAEKPAVPAAAPPVAEKPAAPAPEKKAAAPAAAAPVALASKPAAPVAEKPAAKPAEPVASKAPPKAAPAAPVEKAAAAPVAKEVPVPAAPVVEEVPVAAVPPVQEAPVAAQPVVEEETPVVISEAAKPAEEPPPATDENQDAAEPQSTYVGEPLPDEEPAQAEHHEDGGHYHHHENRPSLFIVQIAPEMAPVAKVGGLADVVFGLTRELAIRGNHVETILPKYANMRYDHIYDLQPVFNDLWVPWYEGSIHCTVYFGHVYDRKCFFIEPHSNDNFFNRGSIYGFQDDVMRYAFFSRAAMEFLWKAGKHPDIIHCHDWQTALVPVFLYEFYQRMGMTHPRVCLTIHNFQHQGVTGKELLRATGLNNPDHFFDYNRMRDNHHPNALNLLKGGIVYSNFVTTVSPRYAFETKDQGQGFGLEPTLHTHHIKYGGVVNGVDYDVWNPEVDRHIPHHFGVDNVDGKYEVKRALRQRLMLADNGKPIVAFIGRLDPQKGLELVRHAIFYALQRDAQFVLLGSSPYQGINDDFWNLKRMLNESPDCHLEIGFDEDLSHLIYAGADMILVPSRFEPCGLTQLIAMRYGTVPVVRSVGGLADTVFDKDYSDRPLHERNGYVFENYDGPGLESALGRAIACYYEYPEHFRELMKNAMRTDYSWNYPGRDYLNIYDYIRSK